MSTTNPYLNARQAAESGSSSEQEKNRGWWEELPMTYVDWEKTERTLSRKEQFENVRRVFLDSNPWLRDQFDFGCCKGKSVLEIGCGTGVASCLFAAAGAEVTAIDLTAKAVEMAKAGAGHFNLQMNIRQMDAEHLDFPSESFDYVFSWGVIHHSAHTENIVREIRRVLKPRGEGLLMVYHRNSLRYYGRGFQWLLLRGKIFQGFSLKSVQSFFTDGYYHRHFTPAEFRSFLASANLRVTDMCVTHMSKKLVRFLPISWNEALKRRCGWLLVARLAR